LDKEGDIILEKVDISVNLCTYNRAEMLQNVLTSLINQETRGEFTFEVVVIDDGSTDSTQEILKKVSMNSGLIIRYFREERVGVAAARNRGVVESKGEWIAFIDDDETAEPNWLLELVTTARTSGADCIGGTLKLMLGEDARNIAATARKHLGENPRFGWFQKRFTYTGPGTGNSLVRRILFETVGLFDANLRVVGEDQDFFRRARKAGYKTVFTSKALVHHFMPVNRLQPSYLLALARQNGKSLAYFDCREWGCLKSFMIFGLRLGHILLKMGLVTLNYTIMHDKKSFFGLKCSIHTTLSYFKELSSQILIKKLPGVIRFIN